MALLVTDLIQAIRDRLADTESTPMFTDTELKRHIASAVKDFSGYRPTIKTTTVTIQAAPTTRYALPDDCLVVIEVRVPAEDNAVFDDWEQVDNNLVVAEDLIDSVSSLTVYYGALHAKSGSGASETYATIQSLHERDVVDLATAYCFLILSSDMNKRPTYGDTQVKVDHNNAPIVWQRQAYHLREDVQRRLVRGGSGIG